MSEQGWYSFLAAEGGEDWVVLHGGATAVFRVGSLSEGARLAVTIAKAPVQTMLRLTPVAQGAALYS